MYFIRVPPAVIKDMRVLPLYIYTIGYVCVYLCAVALGLPVTGDGAGPPGDIPGREGTFPKKLGDIPASSISPTPRRGYTIRVCLV